MVDRRAFLKNLAKLIQGLGLMLAIGEPNHGRCELPRNVQSQLIDYRKESENYHETQKDKPVAAVLGGGVAGLAAARTLALNGWGVDVFEQSPHAGGFCSTLVIDEFTFDFGPHVFAKTIRELVSFKPCDLCPATFSESFLVNGRVLNFPSDVFSLGYISDMVFTFARNMLDPARLRQENMEQLALASFGEQATTQLFRPLMEKWCGSALNSLDHRYVLSRMHARLEWNFVKIHSIGILTNFFLRHFSSREESVNSHSPSNVSGDAISDAPGYSGRIGARIVPDRLMSCDSNINLHCNSSVNSIDIENGRIVRIEAGGIQCRPDFVINTIPLNRFAALIRGTDDLISLSHLEYLNIVFVFVRLSRPGLLKTEWTWIPDASVPFYRISEMKILNESHAPKNCTGLCLEVSLRENDPRNRESSQYWTNLASDFLTRSFSISSKEIIGMNVEIRNAGYPMFLKKNTQVISKLLSRPYVSGEQTHEFLLPIDNLALAGRAGTFLYLLTPGAITSGINAAKRALACLPTKIQSWPIR